MDTLLRCPKLPLVFGAVDDVDAIGRRHPRRYRRAHGGTINAETDRLGVGHLAYKGMNRLPQQRIAELRVAISLKIDRDDNGRRFFERL